ncbi:MAG: hypothetical protein KAJ48_07310, partial [Elusimicrobiales bacterium]|nr:hypothetical protein [Elusimicrobiales bacterium]
DLYHNSISAMGGNTLDPPATYLAAGIDKVWTQIKDVNEDNHAGEYWDNATSTFTVTWSQNTNESAYYIAGASWTYTVSYPTAAFSNGVQYEIRAKASDLTYNNAILEGSQSDLSTSKIFHYDIAIPTATFTSAENGDIRSSLNLASGTILETMVFAYEAGQPGMQIDNIKLHIKDNVWTQYWTGSAWNPSSLVSTDSLVHQSSWVVTALPNWDDEGSYTIWSEAIDKAGNTQTIFTGNGSSVTFTVDKSAPLLDITSISANDKIASLVSVSGTANDPNWDTNSGIALAENIQIQVSYIDDGDTYYYDGATQFSSSTLDNTNSWWIATNWAMDGPSSGTWTYAPGGLSSTMVSDKLYSIRARAQDNAIPTANPADLMANIYNVFDVIYDTTPPSILISSPVINSKLNTIPDISGTADADLSGLKDVRINVSSWSAGVWSTVSSNNPADNIWQSSWSWTGLAGLISNTTYQIVAKAQDNSNNWSVVYSTTSFIYDGTKPTVSISKPVNERYYGDNSSENDYYLDMFGGSASDAFDIDKT